MQCSPAAQTGPVDAGRRVVPGRKTGGGDEQPDLGIRVLPAREPAGAAGSLAQLGNLVRPEGGSRLALSGG